MQIEHDLTSTHVFAVILCRRLFISPVFPWCCCFCFTIILILFSENLCNFNETMMFLIRYVWYWWLWPGSGCSRNSFAFFIRNWMWILHQCVMLQYDTLYGIVSMCFYSPCHFIRWKKKNFPRIYRIRN